MGDECMWRCVSLLWSGGVWHHHCMKAFSHHLSIPALYQGIGGSSQDH